jgi:hypothetical protein
MRQNINLYQAALIDKPEPLRTRQAGLLLFGLLALLLVVSLFSYRHLRSQQGQLTQLQQQEIQRGALVAELEQQFPSREKDALLAAKIHQLEQQLAGQKQLLGYFSNQKKVADNRILGTLEGLAKHVQKGVWLNRIQLDESGSRVELSGTALRPEQIPAYLQYLGQQRVFNGQVFSRFKLIRLKERPGEVDFSLASAPEERP